MHRLLVLCLAAALVTACKKKEPEATSPAEPAAAAQANAAAPSLDSDEAPAIAEAAPEPGEQEKQEDEKDKLELEASMVEPYLAYRKEIVAAALVSKQKFEVLEKNLEKNKDKEGGALDIAVLMKKGADIQDELKKGMDDARKKSGLTDVQFRALDDVFTHVQLAHTMKDNDPTIPFEKALAGNKHKATPEQIAEAQAEIDEMRKSFESMVTAADAREEYGDEIVDAIFARYADFDAPVTEVRNASK